MAWTVELSDLALKNLDQLDRQVACRILKFLSERVSCLDDPRCIGQALQGHRLGSLWKYRVGDYRIIASIEDSKMLVLVVRVGHRQEVYR